MAFALAGPEKLHLQCRVTGHPGGQCGRWQCRVWLAGSAKKDKLPACLKWLFLDGSHQYNPSESMDIGADNSCPRHFTGVFASLAAAIVVMSVLDSAVACSGCAVEALHHEYPCLSFWPAIFGGWLALGTAVWYRSESGGEARFLRHALAVFVLTAAPGLWGVLLGFIPLIVLVRQERKALLTSGDWPKSVWLAWPLGIAFGLLSWSMWHPLLYILSFAPMAVAAALYFSRTRGNGTKPLRLLFAGTLVLLPVLGLPADSFARAEWYSGGFDGAFVMPGDAVAIGLLCGILDALAWVPVTVGLIAYLTRDRAKTDRASYALLAAGALASALALATWNWPAVLQRTLG